MTREDVILCLKGIKNLGRDMFTEQKDFQECIDMAIKVLEQETVPREHYEHEFFLRKELDFKVARLEKQIAEQEPYDCVSRKSLLDKLDPLYKEKIKTAPNNMAEGFLQVSNLIKNEPPATHTRKKGKWIKVTETDFGIGYKCSECGRFILTESVDGKKLKDYPYCHCGAKMEVEE